MHHLKRNISHDFLHCRNQQFKIIRAIGTGHTENPISDIRQHKPGLLQCFPDCSPQRCPGLLNTIDLMLSRSCYRFS